MSRSGAHRGVVLPTMIIGIGLSGFFDGILLHQVLQWHHLLSLVPGDAFRDIGTQILADGLFHVLMYIVTAAGLWILWRRRAALASGGASWRSVAGGGLLGFGIWNVIDVGFFHWTLGIHRIRVNVPDPMMYDVGWLAVFGLLPIAMGWLILRGSHHGGSSGGPVAAVSIAALALAGAMVAARPLPNSDTAIVFFAPGTELAQAINVARSAEAPIVWIDPRGRMMAVSLPRSRAVGQLYGPGTLFVTRSPALAGCGAALKA